MQNGKKSSIPTYRNSRKSKTMSNLNERGDIYRYGDVNKSANIPKLELNLSANTSPKSQNLSISSVVDCCWKKAKLEGRLITPRQTQNHSEDTIPIAWFLKFLKFNLSTDEFDVLDNAYEKFKQPAFQNGRLTRKRVKKFFSELTNNGTLEQLSQSIMELDKENYFNEDDNISDEIFQTARSSGISSLLNPPTVGTETPDSVISRDSPYLDNQNDDQYIQQEQSQGQFLTQFEADSKATFKSLPTSTRIDEDSFERMSNEKIVNSPVTPTIVSKHNNWTPENPDQTRVRLLNSSETHLTDSHLLSPSTPNSRENVSLYNIESSSLNSPNYNNNHIGDTMMKIAEHENCRLIKKVRDQNCEIANKNKEITAYKFRLDQAYKDQEEFIKSSEIDQLRSEGHIGQLEGRFEEMEEDNDRLKTELTTIKSIKIKSDQQHSNEIKLYEEQLTSLNNKIESLTEKVKNLEIKNGKLIYENNCNQALINIKNEQNNEITDTLIENPSLELAAAVYKCKVKNSDLAKLNKSEGDLSWWKSTISPPRLSDKQYRNIKSKSSVPIRSFHLTEETIANSETIGELLSKSKSIIDDNFSDKSHQQANTTTGMSLYEEMVNCGSINNETNREIFETSFSDDGIQVKDNVMNNVSGNTTNEMHLDESDVVKVEKEGVRNSEILVEKITNVQNMRKMMGDVIEKLEEKLKRSKRWKWFSVTLHIIQSISLIYLLLVLFADELLEYGILTEENSNCPFGNIHCLR